MSTLSSYALEIDATNEVVSAYASGPKTLQAHTNNRWIALGSFALPAPVRAKLQVIGFTTTGTTLQVKLFAPLDIETSLLEVVTLFEGIHVGSNYVDFEADRLYTIAANVVASTEDTSHFGLIRSVSLVLP